MGSRAQREGWALPRRKDTSSIKTREKSVCVSADMFRRLGGRRLRKQKAGSKVTC